MPALKHTQLIPNAKQLPHKIFNIRRKSDDQLRRGLGRQQQWGGPSRQQLSVQLRRPCLQLLEKRGVKLHQALALIQATKVQAMCKS